MSDLTVVAGNAYFIAMLLYMTGVGFLRKAGITPNTKAIMQMMISSVIMVAGCILAVATNDARDGDGLYIFSAFNCVVGTALLGWTCYYAYKSYLKSKGAQS